MTTILSPTSHGDVIDLGRNLFRKQVLKVGQIDYKGRKLDFTPDYLRQLADSYRAGAMDQVPFQLATADNAHNDLPERTRGEVKALEFTGDGLDAILELTPDAAEMVKANPKLGVSARLEHDYARSDGKKWPAVVKHVLATLDPVVTGMRPWAQVADLSNTDGGDVIDLSTEEITMAEEQPQNDAAAEVDDAVADQIVERLDDESLAAIRAILEGDDADENEEAAVAEHEQEPALVGASLSNEDRNVVDLARAEAQQANDRAAALEQQLANERADREAANYINAGVPPAEVNLARPLLVGASDTIDLSNGEKTSPGDIVRKLLDARKGTISLSQEKGHGGKSDDLDPHEAELKKAWDKDWQ